MYTGFGTKNSVPALYACPKLHLMRTLPMMDLETTMKRLTRRRISISRWNSFGYCIAGHASPEGKDATHGTNKTTIQESAAHCCCRCHLSIVTPLLASSKTQFLSRTFDSRTIFVPSAHLLCQTGQSSIRNKLVL